MVMNVHEKNKSELFEEKDSNITLLHRGQKDFNSKIRKNN